MTNPRRVAKLAATKSASGPSLWINRDPIGERGGINLYSYALNSTIRYVDLTGLTLHGLDQKSKADIEKVRNGSATGKNNVEQLEKSKKRHTVQSKSGKNGNVRGANCKEEDESNGNGVGTDTTIDPDGYGGWPSDTILSHELQHAADKDAGIMEPKGKDGSRPDKNGNGYPDSEDRAVDTQNLHSINKEGYEHPRSDYGDKNISPTKR